MAKASGGGILARGKRLHNTTVLFIVVKTVDKLNVPQ